MALNPAPGSRQRVLTFVTPKVGDILFYETRSDDKRSVTPPYGTAHPDATRFPNHKFVFARSAKEDGTVYHWFYAAERADQDGYNWEKSTTSLGGARFDTVTRTYVNLRSSYDDTTPEPADPMPDVPEDVFTDYVFWDKEQKRIGDNELDSIFIVEQHVFLKRNAREKLEVDDTFGGTLKTIQNLITADEFGDLPSSHWGVQNDGTKREYEQIDDDWYVEITRDLVPSDLIPDENGEGGRSYDTSVNFSWPAVLGGFSVFGWGLRAGGADIYTTSFMEKEAYSGPCSATVRQQFFASPPNTLVTPPEVMRPERIDINTPFFGISIPPSLHNSLNLTFSTGNNHPKYEDINYPYTKPATNPTDWDPEVIASDEVRPFRGGYLRETVFVRPPSYPPPPPPSSP